MITQSVEEISIDFSIFDEQKQNTVDCLIVLNLLKFDPLFDSVMKSVKIVILADGGANHFYASHHRDNQKVKSIVGDFDSARKDVLQYYKNRNVLIQQVEDQDYNDFQKAIQKAKQFGVKSCVCWGAIGGRMDHTLSSLHIAHKISVETPDMHLFLFGDNNLMFSVRPNVKYTVKIGQFFNLNGCGLVPFGNAQKIQTTGFKWDLGKEKPFSSLKWGSFISTSNSFENKIVTILTSDHLYFVASLKDNQKNQIKNQN